MSSDQVQAGGLTVTLRGPVRDAAENALQQLRASRVASRLAAKDATLWGPAAEPEASIRLGWVDLPQESRALLPQISEIAQAKREAGLDRVVLAGMGGSSLAPEVIAASRDARLITLDTTDPHQVRRVVTTDLDRTANPLGYASNFFDFQARALMDGHLWVTPGSLGIEAFHVDGREYMYFGPFPALLRIPVLWTTPEYDGRLTVVHKTAIEDGMYEPEADYTTQPL